MDGDFLPSFFELCKMHNGRYVPDGFMEAYKKRTSTPLTGPDERTSTLIGRVNGQRTPGPPRTRTLSALVRCCRAPKAS